MYANVFETKEKQKLTEIKNYLQHKHQSNVVVITTMTEETEEVETCLEKFNDTDRISKDEARLIRAVNTIWLRTKLKRPLSIGKASTLSLLYSIL